MRNQEESLYQELQRLRREVLHYKGLLGELNEWRHSVEIRDTLIDAFDAKKMVLGDEYKKRFVPLLKMLDQEFPVKEDET